MTRLDLCIDCIISFFECTLSLALMTLGLSLPAVSALQAITSSGSLVVMTLASAVFVGLVVVYALMAYAAVSAAFNRVHYLY